MQNALAARRTLLAQPSTTAWRVFNGTADGIAGLVIEKLGGVLIAQLHEQRLQLGEPAVRELCVWAAERLGVRAVYRKSFPKDRSRIGPRLAQLHTDANPWIGAAVEPEFAVLEDGLRFLVRPYDGYATGLFLEQRENRGRVRALAAGRRVLNTFAYTCGFTVAAASGGAAETVSVDISPKSLDWGRRNLATNGLPLEPHQFVRSDVFEYYRRAGRRGRHFDLIVLDPPTFSRARRTRRVFSIIADLEPLVAGALSLLEANGLVLLCTNRRETTHEQLLRCIAGPVAAARRRYELVAFSELPEDFRGDPDYAKSVLVRVR